jgi:hypothetical protein
MTIAADSRWFRRANPLRLVLFVMLGLSLLVFTVASGSSHLRSGVAEQSHLIAPHHASHDGHLDRHPANALCGIACAASIVVAEWMPEASQARGVPPAIIGRIDEHSPDDPLPPPRSAARN